MFKRTMQAFKVAKEQWVYKPAPQLNSKAQQPFATVEKNAGDYDQVKLPFSGIIMPHPHSIHLKKEIRGKLAVRVRDLTKSE